MIRRGHVYFAALPDESKRRPVVVLSPDRRNELASDVVVVPCSTVGRWGPWHVPLPRGTGGLPQASVVKCEQVTTVRKDRLSRASLDGPLGPQVMARIREAVLRALDFDE